MTPLRDAEARSRRGFTLIEIMAVVLIIGLFMSVLVPQMSGLGTRALEDQARLLAGQLELARQRAVMTGSPHRLVLDFDEFGYWIEMATSESETEAAPVAGSRLLDLSPPGSGRRSYEPLPGQSGDGYWLAEPFVLTGIETPEGWVDRGTYDIEFDPDGATEGVSIVIRNENAGVALDVHPLIDSVQIRADEA